MLIVVEAVCFVVNAEVITLVADDLAVLVDVEIFLPVVVVVPGKMSSSFVSFLAEIHK